ncbi:MAG: hypothetical protein Q9204_006944, partial [Flavoplaca sp. TL-2023a]
MSSQGRLRGLNSLGRAPVSIQRRNIPGGVHGYFPDDFRAPARVDEAAWKRCSPGNTIGLGGERDVNPEELTHGLASSGCTTQNSHPRAYQQALGKNDLGDPTKYNQPALIPNPRSSTGAAQNTNPPYLQQQTNQRAIPDGFISQAEQSERDHLQRTRDRKLRVATQAQKNLDYAHLLHKQDRQAFHDHYLSTQRSSSVLHTSYSLPRESSRAISSSLADTSARSQDAQILMTTPSYGKRSRDQRDDNEDAPDVNGQGRRVRSRLGLGYPEAPAQSIALKPTPSTGGPKSRRHEHPSRFMRASQSTNRIGSSQPSMGVNNMGLPNINTISQPQESPSLQGEDLLTHNNFLPHPNSPSQTQSVYGGNNFQSWADNSSSVVQQAFASTPTRLASLTTSDLKQDSQYSPPKAQLGSENLPNMPRRLASKLATVASTARAAQNLATNITAKKRRRQTDEVTEEESLLDQNDQDSKSKQKSGRENKRQCMEARGIELPKGSEKAMGKVLYDRHGQMYVMIEGRPEPAAYHNDRRHSLLAHEDAKGSYRYPLERGVHEDDRTAYHEDYADINWTDRNSRPDVLFQWKAPAKGTVTRPGYLRDPNSGEILISAQRHPILNWREIPMTLSGQVNGQLLELIKRRNQHIRLEDSTYMSEHVQALLIPAFKVVARTPDFTQKESSKGTCAVMSLGPSTYGNRMQEARMTNGTCAWEGKEGTLNIKLAIENVIPQRVLDERAQYNTTRSWRDLAQDEINAIKSMNRGIGSAIKRAGNRALSKDEKEVIDGIKSQKAKTTLRRLLQEKEIDDAEYTRTGINTDLLPQNPTAVRQPQQVPLAAPQGVQQPVQPVQPVQQPRVASQVPRQGLSQGLPKAAQIIQRPSRIQLVSQTPNLTSPAGAVEPLADEGDTTLGEDYAQLDTIDSVGISQNLTANEDYNTVQDCTTSTWCHEWDEFMEQFAAESSPAAGAFNWDEVNYGDATEDVFLSQDVHSAPSSWESLKIAEPGTVTSEPTVPYEDRNMTSSLSPMGRSVKSLEVPKPGSYANTANEPSQNEGTTSSWRTGEEVEDAGAALSTK